VTAPNQRGRPLAVGQQLHATQPAAQPSPVSKAIQTMMHVPSRQHHKQLTASSKACAHLRASPCASSIQHALH